METTATAHAPFHLRAMSRPEMESMLAGAGFERYRAGQLFHWVFARGVDSLEAMGNLPARLRQWLKANAVLADLSLEKTTGPEGGTRKVLFRLRDGRAIESVLMRDEEDPDKASLCLSSQVGCAVGCVFCMTGFGGFQRQLTVDEITGQAIEIRRQLLGPEVQIGHVVLMGMGEPMLNLEAVAPALRLLTDPDGLKLSRRRLTVSTAGVVPGIEAFGQLDLGVGLAVSLNATTDEVRSRIMPINNKWNIERLLETLRHFPMEQRRRITIEYVLIKGINDTPEDARRLTHLLRDLRCKVNLIMFNPSPHLPYEPVEEAVMNHFADVLARAHYTITIRWSKGRDIEAACGQLAAHHFEASHA